MPDAQGNFRGIAVPAEAWERVFEGKRPIAHLEDPMRDRRSLCGTTLKRKPAPATEPCVVCLSMKTYGRFAGR